MCPKLHRIELIFINPIFHNQSLYYWYLFITEVCLTAALVEFNMNCFPLLLSSLPSTSIYAHSHPYSYSQPLPLIEKQDTVQPILSGHSRGMAP